MNETEIENNTKFGKYIDIRIRKPVNWHGILTKEQVSLCLICSFSKLSNYLNTFCVSVNKYLTHNFSRVNQNVYDQYYWFLSRMITLWQ